MLKIAKIWQGQFSFKQFSMKHEDPKRFAISEWQFDKSRPNTFYLVYRWMYVLTWITSLIFSVLDVNHWSNPYYQTVEFKLKWLIYLTHWGFTLCTFQALLGAILITQWHLRHRRSAMYHESDDAQKDLSMYKAYWAAYTAAYPVALGITILYWTIIYKASIQLDAMNIILHGMNSVWMVMDLFIVANPMQLLHFYWAVLFGFCYCSFNIIYYWTGGVSREGKHYIYPIMNWDTPWETVGICVMVFLFLIFLHAMVYLLTMVRGRLGVKGAKSEVDESRKGYYNEGMVNEVV